MASPLTARENRVGIILEVLDYEELRNARFLLKKTKEGPKG